jgi:hypothetical protein
LNTHANAYAESFVRSIKESCLERLIFFSEESLRTAIQNFIAHYHAERNHQGLANQLISPAPDRLNNAGEVQRRQRWGGLLNYYYRAAPLNRNYKILDESRLWLSRRELAVQERTAFAPGPVPAIQPFETF